MVNKIIKNLINNELMKLNDYSENKNSAQVDYADFNELSELLLKLHNNFNWLLGYVNNRYDKKKFGFGNEITENGVVTANESRELLKIIEVNDRVLKTLQNNGINICLIEKYERTINVCKQFLIMTSSYISNDFQKIDLEIYNPIYKLKEGFDNVQCLMFGINKPDLIIKDVFSMELYELSKKTIVYNGSFHKGTITNKNMIDWWNEHKTDYPNFQTQYFQTQCTKNENKVRNYYKKFYNNKKYPCLIPQVWYFYDPKLKNNREKGVRPFRDRLDFLLFYNYKRIIIEIDGDEHFDNKNYIEQIKFDREMQLKGYLILRLSNNEINDECLKTFFDTIFEFLEIKQD